MQMKGVGINEDDGLEREAAEISEEMRCKWSTTSQPRYLEKYTPISAEPIQLMKFQFDNKEYDTDHLKGEDRKRVLEELKQRFPAAAPPDIQEAIEILEQGISVEKIIRGDIPSGQTPITAAAAAVTPTETEEMEITDEDTIQIGGGVRFKVKTYNSMTDWIDGYCHKIDGKKYQVYVANRDNRALFGNYVWVDLDKEDKIEPYKEIGMRQPKRPRSDLPLPEAKGQEPTKEDRYSMISPFMLKYPVIFGPVLTPGGQVDLEDVRKAAGKQGLATIAGKATRGARKGREKQTAFVGKDTTAMLATRLYDPITNKGEWIIHGMTTPERDKKKKPLPLLTESKLEKKEKMDLDKNKSKYVFRQGGINPREEIVLPEGDTRKGMHAEAKAIRSKTWQQIIDETVKEFSPPTWPPKMRKIICLIINRSSCGSKIKSGHIGGCAAEIGEVFEEFWRKLKEHLGEEYIDSLKQEEIIRLEVSVGREYTHPGNIEGIFQHGGTVKVHRTYDFVEGKPQMTAGQIDFMERLYKLEQKVQSSKEQLKTKESPPEKRKKQESSEQAGEGLEGRESLGEVAAASSSGFNFAIIPSVSPRLEAAPPVVGSSEKTKDFLAILREHFISFDEIANRSVDDYPGVDQVLADFNIVHISGSGWLCYLRCILHAVGAGPDELVMVFNKLLDQRHDLSDVSGRGVETGSNLDKAIIEAIRTVVNRNVKPIIVVPKREGKYSIDETGIGNDQEVYLLHTGVHFSLLIKK